MKHILVTGAAGFIAANLVMRLLRELNGATIVGLDNMNAYFDVSLKEYRLNTKAKNAILLTDVVEAKNYLADLSKRIDGLP